MFRSATLKLTVWYLTIVMVISLVFSAVLYQVATGELSRTLHRQTLRISQQFPVFQGDPLLRTGPDYDSGARHIFLELAGFNIVVFVSAGFASYWLARRTLQPIEEAHEQQKRFTADVSHELRTPLTAIRMESEVALMNRQTGQRELRQTLTSNLEETAKLEALINNLLRLTRLDADELQQNFTKLQATDLVKAALEQVSKLAKTRHITFDNQTKPVSLHGDRESLIQLLVILLDNAIKYSPSGSTVEISSHRSDQRAVLTIQDHGSGIEQQALEHVFDRFYRAESSRTKDRVAGYGLGLSIAKMIVDHHNGTITLTSRKDHGTKAIISLPTSS